MRTVPGLLVFVLASLSVVPTAARADDACKLVWHSTIPVLMRNGYATVPAEIEGQVVGLIVDTGASDSTITPQAAALLGLRPIKDYPRTASVAGVGGAAFFEIDQIHTLVLGGVTYRNIAMWQSAISARVGKSTADLVAGLLGADLLARYDVALDESASSLMLYTARPGCGPIAPPDAASGKAHWSAVPIDIGEGDQLLVNVMVNGQPARAVLDSGAPGALMDAAAARRLGLASGGRTVQVGGIGEDRVTVEVQRLASLSVGGIKLPDTPLLVATQSLPLLQGADMLLGTSLLARVPVMISYRSHTLWLKAP